MYEEFLTPLLLQVLVTVLFLSVSLLIDSIKVGPLSSPPPRIVVRDDLKEQSYRGNHETMVPFHGIYGKDPSLLERYRHRA